MEYLKSIKLDMEGKEDTTRNEEREHGHDENSAGEEDKKQVIEDTALDKVTDEDLQLQAFDVVYNAFAQILEIDTASIKKDTDFFEEGGGSLQICELQDYLSKDNGQDPKLRHKLEQ